MSAVTLLNPVAIATPLGAYSQAVLCRGEGHWLQVSGQIGAAPDGSLPDSVEAQAENVWNNLLAVLREAGMTVSDLVKITTYVVDAAALPVASAVRARYIGEHRPASTVVVAQALASPEWLIEIEAVAFKISL